MMENKRKFPNHHIHRWLWFYWTRGRFWCEDVLLSRCFSSLLLLACADMAAFSSLSDWHVSGDSITYEATSSSGFSFRSISNLRRSIAGGTIGGGGGARCGCSTTALLFVDCVGPTVLSWIRVRISSCANSCSIKRRFIQLVIYSTIRGFSERLLKNLLLLFFLSLAILWEENGG